MAFTIKTWVDRLAEFPNRRRLDSAGIADTYDVTRSEGNVTTEGDKFDAPTMNDLEERIAAGFEDTVSAEDLAAHVNDEEKHLKPGERAAWTAKAGRSTVATATLAASAWTGTDAPYSITVSVAAAKPEPTRIEVQPSPDATADQWAAWRAALIRGGGQGTGTITLLADGDKPEIDIPITVTVRGDV